MSLLILFALASIGATEILVASSLFSPVREYLKSRLPEALGKAIECRQCLGTWVGFVIGAGIDPWHFILYGFAGSCLAITYHRVFVLADEYVFGRKV